jgi:signal transduction histidine kinase
VRGERALASVGRQMDDVLQELRSLARGIYPSLLHECGLREALRAAARNSPIPVAVRAASIGRYPEDLEVAVYFCCLEALQNVVKHAGPDATTMVTLSRDGPVLLFEVHDSGVGFDPNAARPGNGLINMRDRIEAIGGTLKVTARRGRGTSVRGRVPVS